MQRKCKTSCGWLAFGADHPYGHSVGGSVAEVAAATLPDACAFLERHYQPKNAILVVSGAIDVAAAEQRVAAMFGPLQPLDEVRALDFPVTSPRLRGGQTRHQVSVEEPAVALLFAAPPWGSPDYSTLQLIVELYGMKLRELRDDNEFITGFGLSGLGGWRGGAVAFYLAVEDEKYLPRAVELFNGIQPSLLEGVDELLFDVLRARLRSSLVRQNESFAARSAGIADYLQYTNHDRLMHQDLDVIDQLSHESVHQYLDEHFRQSMSHVALLVPDGKDAPAARRVELAAAHELGAFEIDRWKAPVEAADAERDLPLPGERARPEVQRLKLPTGLEVALVSDLSYPVVDMRLVYRAGSLYDPNDAPGTAALAAELLSNDVTALPTYAVYRSVRSILLMGGAIDTATDEKSTTFRITGLDPYADGLLWQLYWRAQHGNYDGEDLVRLRKAVERAEDDEPAGSGPMLAALLYGPDHPRARDERASSVLARISTAELKEFHAAHHRLGEALLVVTGRFDAADMTARIRRLFGDWTGPTEPGAPPPDRPKPQPQRGARVAHVDDELVQPQLVVALPMTIEQQDTAAALVLEQIIEQRLGTIRETLGASYGVNVGFDDGTLLISGELDARRAGVALGAIVAELAGLRDRATLAEDFVRARRKVYESMLADAISSSSVAGEIVTAWLKGWDERVLQEMMTSVARLRPAQVLRLIDEQLNVAQAIIFVSGPEATAEATLRGAGLTPTPPPVLGEVLAR